MPIDLAPGTTVLVLPPVLPRIDVAPPVGPSVQVVPLQGPPGPRGEPGAGVVVDWFVGEGPPGVIVGAGPGDMYIDELTGELYQLR